MNGDISVNAEAVGQIIDDVESGKYGYVNGKGMSMLSAIYDRLTSAAGTYSDKISDREQGIIRGITENGWYSYVRKPRKDTDRTAFLYLAADQSNSRYKIGRSVNPKKRVASMRTACPRILLIAEWTIQYNYDPIEFEKYIHRLLSEWNIEGEWYRFPETDGPPSEVPRCEFLRACKEGHMHFKEAT